MIFSRMVFPTDRLRSASLPPPFLSSRPFRARVPAARLDARCFMPITDPESPLDDLDREPMSIAEEIAEAMGCPVGTVRSRIFRAREAIDNRLRDVFEGGLGRSEEL